MQRQTCAAGASTQQSQASKCSERGCLKQSKKRERKQPSLGKGLVGGTHIGKEGGTRGLAGAAAPQGPCRSHQGRESPHSNRAACPNQGLLLLLLPVCQPKPLPKWQELEQSTKGFQTSRDCPVWFLETAALWPLLSVAFIYLARKGNLW